jgi:hypothetical protein
MPLYRYRNPTTGEIKEIYQKMKDKHEYKENDKAWDRLFDLPNYSIDSMADPYNPQDFVKATNKKGSVQDLFDRSRELSEKRKDKDGKDLVKEKYMDNWEKTRKGKGLHPERKIEQQKKIQETAAKSGFDVSF